MTQLASQVSSSFAWAASASTGLDRLGLGGGSRGGGNGVAHMAEDQIAMPWGEDELLPEEEFGEEVQLKRLARYLRMDTARSQSAMSP